MPARAGAERAGVTIHDCKLIANFLAALDVIDGSVIGRIMLGPVLAVWPRQRRARELSVPLEWTLHEDEKLPGEF